MKIAWIPLGIPLRVPKELVNGLDYCGACTVLRSRCAVGRPARNLIEPGCQVQVGRYHSVHECLGHPQGQGKPGYFSGDSPEGGVSQMFVDGVVQEYSRSSSRSQLGAAPTPTLGLEAVSQQHHQSLVSISHVTVIDRSAQCQSDLAVELL